MKYRVTVAQTLYTAMQFEAETDKEAEEKARNFANAVENFDESEPEYDYVLEREDGAVLKEWD